MKKQKQTVLQATLLLAGILFLLQGNALAAKDSKGQQIILQDQAYKIDRVAQEKEKAGIVLPDQAHKTGIILQDQAYKIDQVAQEKEKAGIVLPDQAHKTGIILQDQAHKSK